MAKEEFGPEREQMEFLIGEDRGADIEMTKCVVEHSRFCKGMLVYSSVHT